MIRNAKILATLVILVVMGSVVCASSASAYGQCGGEVHSAAGLLKAWKAMGVVPQVEEELKSAGYNSEDGSFKKFLEDRVILAKLARTAFPEDYGCHPGELFSVGPREQAKGTGVFVVLPMKYAKSEIRNTPHKGYKRIVAKGKIVGLEGCSNPNSGTVYVYLYVKVVVQHEPKKSHKKEHVVKPKPAPECSTKSPTGGGGNCSPTTVTVTPEQKCGAEDHSSAGGCIQNTTVITVGPCSNYTPDNSGNVSNGGNCNSGGTETCVGQGNCTTHEEETCVSSSCNVTPPPKEECGCKPEEPEKPKSPPKVELETINDFEVNEPGTICARTTATTGDSLSVTFFAKGGGEFHNHGVGSLRSGTTNEWCDTYTASSEAGNSIIKVVVQDNTTGLSGEDEQTVTNKAETSF